MAAGLGFKTFTTGEVLTAADTNGYLMQGINVFASTAARDAAITSPQEGQFAYTKDTNSLWYYTGSAWAASGATGDIEGVTAGVGISGGGTSGTVTITNSMATEIAAKGDLIVGTGAATFDNLAVGANGETLVADSSTSTGLRYQPLFGANKNKLINGDLFINQRGFTSETANGIYTFDRWRTGTGTGGTVTFSTQTFTPGAAPVSGYEGKNFLQIVTSGQTGTAGRAIFQQPIEDVRTFAGQTVTVSFWAKAASGTPNINVEIAQQFGSGGSSQVTGIKTTIQTITTSWNRYSFVIAVPSVSGKTIGDGSAIQPTIAVSGGSDFDARYGAIGNQNNTFQIWGIQIEAGSVATPFQTATGTIQGELAACQRYYYRANGSGSAAPWTIANYFGSANCSGPFTLPIPMRITPTFTPSSGTIATIYSNGTSGASTAISDNGGNNHTAFILFARAGTANSPASVTIGSGYLEWSAEL